MRFLTGILIAGLLATALTLSAMAQTEPSPANQAAVCEVPAHYLEATNENNRTLLKLLGMVNAFNSPVHEAETAATYYAMLASTRQYYEGQRAELPDCAQPVNDAMISTIAATQDTLTMMMNLDIQPDSRRAANRVVQARGDLNVAWTALSTTTQQAGLVSAE